MKKLWIILGAIFVLLLMVFSWYVKGVNTVVRLHEEVNESWAQIDTQLQRRNDLIPNMVETVKGYAKHEKEVFLGIANARAAYAGAKSMNDKIDAAKSMDSALARLLVVIENYPQLKANDTFQTMMAELEGTENRIAVARTRYNKAVLSFNSHIREFFGSFFANIKNLNKSLEYFNATEEAKGAAPKVTF